MYTKLKYTLFFLNNKHNDTYQLERLVNYIYIITKTNLSIYLLQSLLQIKCRLYILFLSYQW